jgi:cell surface protein SprA
VEQRWLSGAPPSGADVCGTTDPTAYVACEEGYLVHVGDPGINPPNLAAAQELSAGIYRATGLGIMSEAELWVDDIRLANPLAETGSAIAFDSRLIASDVGSVTASYVRQNGQFRFLNSDPSYRTSQVVTIDSRWQLDRFLPSGLGISAPFSITHARTAVDPELLTGTDLRGSALAGLRRPSNRSTTFALALRRSSKGTDWFTRSFLDPFQLAASLTQGRSGTEYSTAQSSNYNVTLGYNIQMRRRGFRLPLGWLVGTLPDFIRTSETGKGLQNPQVSLVPSTLRLSSGLTRDWAEQRNFGVPIVRGDDALVRPTLALNHLWRNAAGLTWQPLGLVTLSSDLNSTRDLRVYPDSSPPGVSRTPTASSCSACRSASSGTAR